MPLERGKPSTASGRTGAPINPSGRTGAPINPSGRTGVPIAVPGGRPLIPPPKAMEDAVRDNLGRTHLSLRAIRDELEMFEKEIKWRDERLGQLEKELHQERARRTPEGAAYSDRMRETRQQLEQHAAALRERDARIQTLVLKERELLGRVQTLTHERGKSAQALADMVKQIQEQQRRTQLLEEKLVQQLKENQAREAALKTAEASAVAAQPVGGWPAMSGPARVGIVLTLLLIVGASIALGVTTLLKTQPRFRVAGQLVVPADQAAVIEAELKDDPRYADIRTQRRPLGAEAAGISLVIDATPLQAEAKAELDTLGRSFVVKLAPPATIPLDTADQRATLERRLKGIDEQMETLATQPAQASVAGEMSVLKSWRELLSERQNAQTQLGLLRPRLAASRPAADQIAPEEAELAALERADTQLQANIEMLAAREKALRELLRQPLEAGEPVFTRFAGDITAATLAVGDASKDVSDQDVIQATVQITKALGEWKQSLSELQDGWQIAAGGVREAKTDLLDLQSKLEPAVRSFVDRSRAHREAINTAIESLGEGGDEPTKRIVLRNGLARQLKPLLDTHESAAEVLKPLLSVDNAELSGALQAISGLATQISTQKERLRTTAREQALRRANDAYDQAMQAARAENERWLQRAAELDEALLEQNRKALELLPQMDGERSAAQRRAERYQERAGVLAQLAELSRRDAAALAENTAQFVPWYIPAEATQLPPAPRERLGQAVLLGSIPIGIGALILVALWAGQLYLRSRQLATDYERLLREASTPR